MEAVEEEDGSYGAGVAKWEGSLREVQERSDQDEDRI